MNRFIHFIFYNNTIPLIFGVLFLGAGATFAASTEARDAVVGSESKLASIDNSYLLNTAITEDTITITINSVTENEEMYFVEYLFGTIGVVDGAWQPVTTPKIFEVQKSSIVGQDLGLYVEEELRELHAYELRKLKERKEIERSAGITPKAEATEYSGLVGQFFDPNIEVFPSYEPVITETPLTKEQEKAHAAIKRLVEETRNKERENQKEQENQSQSEPLEETRGEPTTENGEEPPSVEEEPPVENFPTNQESPQESPSPETTLEPPQESPSPETTLEPPKTLENIGL